MPILLLIILAFFFLPAVGALVAIARTRSLGLRLEDVEKREFRISERLSRLESRGVASAVPVERVTVAVPAPAPIPAPAPAVVAPAPRPPVVSPRPLFVAPPRAPEPPKENVPLENLIGERILPRLGVVAIVLGLGLLVWYSYTNLGPQGRLALAGGVGAAMVGGGVYLRRGERTGLLGGCLVGGGWAVMYVTAYAAGFVETSRIIASPELAFGLLMGVSAAALIHALRYRNETIAGLAYLLTIASLFLAPAAGPSAWLALSLAAGTLVVLAWRERWIRLCTVGAALLYFAEATWLADPPVGSVVPALAVLAALWAMWILPDYFHRPSKGGEVGIHGLLVGINFVGGLVVACQLQNWFALEYKGWIFVILGALYAIHALVGRTRAWRPAYHASLAFSAILAAIGLHEVLPGLGPVFAWMGLAAALFAWGLATKDAVPRVFGMVALAITFGRFWMVDHALRDAWIPALAICGLAYGMAAVIAWLRGVLPARERFAAVILSHLGASALGLAIWNYPPALTCAALCALSGLALVAMARQLGAFPLRVQGIGLLTMAALFVVRENLAATGTVGGISVAIASTAPVLLAWLVARLMPADEDDFSSVSREFMGVLLFAGLLALVHVEVGVPKTPVAWVAICGGWFLWGRLLDGKVEKVLSALGIALAVLAYAAVNPIALPFFGVAGPVASGAAILAILLALHLAGERDTWPRDFMAGALAFTGFVLLAREMSGTWLTGSWAVLGFALAAYGFLVRDRVSRWSSLLVLGICAGKVTLFDLATFDMPVKIATLITLGSVMVTLSFVYARHHRRIVGYLVGKD